MPTKPKVNNSALKDRIMQILEVQHNVAALPDARQAGKREKLEGFVDRAIDERGLTAKHVDENLKLGRPPHWIETGQS